jgi:hypothetical protein
MALDFVIIQPIAAEFEKVFSASGNMMMAIRSRLHNEVIGIRQIFRLWLLAGVIENPDPGLVPLQLNNNTKKNESAGDGEDYSSSDSEEEGLWQGGDEKWKIGSISFGGS